jgi:hypothetical protein
MVPGAMVRSGQARSDDLLMLGTERRLQSKVLSGARFR